MNTENGGVNTNGFSKNVQSFFQHVLLYGVDAWVMSRRIPGELDFIRIGMVWRIIGRIVTPDSETVT